MNRMQNHSIQSVAALLFLALSQVIVAQPVFPELTGPFDVGRIELDVLDEQRAETFTEEPEDKRRLLVSLYYPAEVPAGTARAGYVPEQLMTALSFTDEQRAWPSSGYADFPMREGSYPVLLFSPGLGNMTFLYSSLLYELASEGYVIAALWHPYSTSLTAFPDGSVLRRNDAGGVTGTTLEEQMAELERLGIVWVDDLLFVRDQLAAWNATHPLLQGHLDLERMGAFGHSFGGAAALQAAHQDEGIDAVVNMDGTMFGEVARVGSRVPFLFLQSDPLPPTDEQLSEAGISREESDAEDKLQDDVRNETLRLSANATLRKLEKGRHNAYFTDQLFISAVLPPEERSRRLGDIDPASAFQQIRTWVSDFMALHVRRDGTPLPE